MFMFSTTEVRPLSKAPNPQIAPWVPQCRLPTAPGVCVHLDVLNVENTFQCWLYSV